MLKAPLLTVGIALALPGLPALAQQTQVPDVDATLRQQLELERQRKLPAAKPPAPASSAPASRAPAGPTILVKRFTFEGNERYTAAQLEPVVAGYLNRRVSLADLEVAAADLARYYRAAGWVARVVVPPQKVDEGVVRFKVTEGVLGATRFSTSTDTAALPVKPTVIVGNVQSRQAPGDKMNIPAVERGLLLADDLPGVAVAGSQVTGKKEGETDILLEVNHKGSYFGEVSLDNLGSRSTGQERAMLRLGANSPLGLGDQFDALFQLTRYMQYLRLAGSVPLGADGLKLSANASRLHYKVGTPEFAALEPRGNSSSLGADLLYPVIRTASRNLYLDLAVERKRPYNTATTGVVSDYDISNLLLKIDGNLFDSIGAGGITALNLTQVFGRVNLNDSPAAYVAGDALTAQVAGRFRALRGRLTRTQRIDADWTLVAVLSGQHANKNLDSAEKFYLGGPYGVRAYPANEAGGSKGLMFNADLRWRIPDTGQFGYELSAFYDWGRISNGYVTVPLPGRYSLRGYGMGLSLQAPHGVRLSAMVARRIGSNPGANLLNGHDQDGSLDKTRLWLILGMNF